MQDRRKSLGCQYTDRIRVGLETDSDKVWTAVRENLEFLKSETLATEINNGPLPHVEPIVCRIADADVKIGVDVVSSER